LCQPVETAGGGPQQSMIGLQPDSVAVRLSEANLGQVEHDQPVVPHGGLGHDEAEALLTLGQAAAGAWGDLVSPDAAERAVRLHRSRLRAVDMKFF